MSNQRGGHYGAIVREMLSNESLLWYGRPRAERRLHIGTILLSAVAGLVITTFIAAGFERMTAAQAWTIFFASLGAVLLTVCVIDPWMQGPTVYALTDKRALRACGRKHIAVAYVWLSDLTSVTLTERGRFGTIRCASRQATWAPRRGNADRQPIFLRIPDPRAVYTIIISMRPDLADRYDPAAEWVRTLRGARPEPERRR